MPKRGRKRRKGILPHFNLKAETIQSIIFVGLVILSLLSIFSFLQRGEVPTQLNLILVEYFGLGSVLIPFSLLLFAFLFSRLKSPLKEPNVLFGFLIMFISLVSLLRQGKFGQFFWEQMDFLFTAIPTALIYAASFIIGFVILFNTSIASVVKFFISIGQTVYKYTFGSQGQSKDKKSKNAEETIYIQTPDDAKKEDKKVVQPTLPVAPAINATTPHSPKTLNTSAVQAWKYPPLSIFDDASGTKADRGDVRKNAQIIEQTLDSFGITARVVEVNNSPSVTQYALEVALGTKLAKIINLGNDLAMALAAPGGQIRVEAPIPGRSLVGIEVPNRSLEVVPIRKIMESEVMKEAKSKITVPLGLDVGGKPKVANIAKMPHVLIAGQTGSGKSVCVNSWIASLLFRASPEEVRLIMVDPKRVELTPYNGIPHLLSPVIVEPEKVVSALKWAVSEMEHRYKILAEVGAKNIEGYNDLSGFQSLPYIIIFIDELADIMLYNPAEVEDNICRLAQMARAVGIHLVLATQRPSVDIITGLIKANIPARIAFAVSSMTDSRVILDSPGAEKLLGRGDMLYIPPELAKPVRIQGCFIKDQEINKLIEFLKAQQTTEYNDQITSQPVASPNAMSKNTVSVGGEEHDVVFDQAVKLVRDTGKASASLLQRRLKLGYARAARVLDEMEQAGLIGPANGAKPREILMPHATPTEGED
ncbi:DNA translocase FtsK [Patescibacteria group bacterium]|nr:DNA translocase FtsK [Patescibacteria group bacterium]